ncbi:MAG: hypothetical protein ABII85_00305 [Bacillota bacterium]
MALGKLKNYLDNIGPLVNDVYFFDKDGDQLTEDDLRILDFDNLIVLNADTEEEYDDGDHESDKWVIVNLTLDVKKAAKV